MFMENLKFRKLDTCCTALRRQVYSSIFIAKLYKRIRASCQKEHAGEFRVLGYAIFECAVNSLQILILS